MTRAAWGLAVLAATGCSSLVSDPCESGYVMQSGTCVARVARLDGGAEGVGSDAGSGRGHDAGSDGSVGSDGGIGIDGGSGSAGSDGGVVTDGGIDGAVPPDSTPPPDAFVCALPDLTCGEACVDAQNDPFNCGRCGHVCPTGICSLGVCVGTIEGHVVAIGHDYATHDAAMARVLGNAIGLGDAFRLQVGWYRGTATAAAAAGSQASAASALSAMGRPHDDTQVADPTPAQLATLDVLVVEAQTGRGADATLTGQHWAANLGPFFQRGGVVVVLEGAGGVSYDLAQGAGLYTVAAPVTATNAQVVLVDGSDAVAQQVPTPYLATGSSVTFGQAPAVFATQAGGTVVFHLTR